MPRPENRTTITDLKVLAALAHPARYRLLDLLLTGGERTATQCAAVMEISPSACSYHLRHLARYGLIERVDSDDPQVNGRERRWRAANTGFSFGGPPSSDQPATRSARAAVAAIDIAEGARLVGEYIDHFDELPPAWQDAGILSNYALLVSPDELTRIEEQLDAVLRPYLRVTREDTPEDAATVRVTLHAFRRSDT